MKFILNVNFGTETLFYFRENMLTTAFRYRLLSGINQR